MKKQTLLLLAFIVYQSFSFAQNTKIDSLQHLLKSAKEDTSKVNALNALSWEYLDKDNQKAFESSNQALALAQQLKFKKGEASAWSSLGGVYSDRDDYKASVKAYNTCLQLKKELGDKKGIATTYSNIGIVYKIQSDLAQTLYYYNLALKMREEIGDKKEIGESYNNIGNVLWKQGKLDEALPYQMKAYEIRQEIDDQKGIAFSCNNIGGIYSDKGDYVLALEYYFKSLKILEKMQYKQNLPIIYNNIGNIYRYQENYKQALEWFFKSLALAKENGNKNNMAECYNKIGTVYDSQNKYPEALNFYMQSLKLKEEIGNKFGIAESYNNIGVLYKYQKNYDTALEFLFKALKIKEAIGDKKGLINTNNNIGSVYAKKNNFPLAITYLTKGMDYAKQVGAKDMLRDNYYMFSQTYEQQHNFEKAYQYHLLYTQIKDSILNESKTKQLNELQVKYESVKKDNEITKLQNEKAINTLKLNEQNLLLQKRNYLLFVVFLLLTLLTGGTLLWRSRMKLKNKIANDKAIKETEETERLRIAKDIHDDLGSGLSKINFLSEIIYSKSENLPEIRNSSESVKETAKKLIENMRDLIWALNPENNTLPNLVARMREYTTDYLEGLPIEVEYHLQDNLQNIAINKDYHRELFMIVKESLNNISKHAKATQVHFKVEVQNQALIISIRDNGIGFDPQTIKKGNGLRNMKSRIEALGGIFEIKTETDKYTLLTVSVPIEKLTKHQ